jgi:hypothetical protein
LICEQTLGKWADGVIVNLTLGDNRVTQNGSKQASKQASNIFINWK